MRYLFFIFIFTIITFSSQAQQQVQLNKFMNNKLSLNPGYAGSLEAPCISCVHRSQWVGVTGAPSSEVINLQVPMFNNRVGVGASITHDRIGPTNVWDFGLIYSYRLKFKKGYLGIGVEGTLKGYRVDWNQTTATHVDDDLIPMTESSKFLPDVDAGLYYNSDKFFVGLSISSLLRGDLSFMEDEAGNTDFSRDEIHAYLMSGVVFDAGENLRIKPAFLVKAARNAPVSVDLNCTFIFFDKLWTGMNHRFGGLYTENSNVAAESIGFMLQYQLSNSLRAGISYDYSFSQIKDFNSGSYEFIVQYCLDRKDRRYANPRFF